MTVGEFATLWLERRRLLGYRSVDDDARRLRLHILPTLGALELEAVRPLMVDDLVITLRGRGMAPKTVRNVFAVGSGLFRSARARELITVSPWFVDKGVLPAPADKDPYWRPTAIFTRLEAEALCFDERIFPPLRVVHALLYMAGLRRSEVIRLRLADYEPAKPLDRLNIAITKTGIARAVPVHPILGRILTGWRCFGWAENVGREPTLLDRLVTTDSGRPRSRVDDQHSFALVCDRLGMRRRRGHDLRRTFMSQLRGHPQHNDAVTRLITHGPRRRDMLDVYSTFPWRLLCQQVELLPVTWEAQTPVYGDVISLDAYRG